MNPCPWGPWLPAVLPNGRYITAADHQAVARLASDVPGVASVKVDWKNDLDAVPGMWHFS